MELIIIKKLFFWAIIIPAIGIAGLLFATYLMLVKTKKLLNEPLPATFQ